MLIFVEHIFGSNSDLVLLRRTVISVTVEGNACKKASVSTGKRKLTDLAILRNYMHGVSQDISTSASFIKRNPSSSVRQLTMLN